MKEVGEHPKISHTDPALMKDCLDKIICLLPPEERERTGGYFTIYQSDVLDHSSYTMEGFRVGDVPPEKEDKYRAFSAEKALRLSLHDDHLSSFQSRDEANAKWPGAVRKNATSSIFSFSGLPWKADEALVLMYCVEQGEMGSAQAYQIAQISDNDFYHELVKRTPSLQGPLSTRHP